MFCFERMFSSSVPVSVRLKNAAKVFSDGLRKNCMQNDGKLSAHENGNEETKLLKRKKKPPNRIGEHTETDDTH